MVLLKFHENFYYRKKKNTDIINYEEELLEVHKLIIEQSRPDCFVLYLQRRNLLMTRHKDLIIFIKSSSLE